MTAGLHSALCTKRACSTPWHPVAPHDTLQPHGVPCYCSKPRQEAQALLCTLTASHPRVPRWAGSVPPPRGSCEGESHPQPDCSVLPPQLPRGF